MNRYSRGPTIGGSSKATASTMCQKCLKKGHYSYECKAVAQERPYVSRPSRTQQLLNPKLVPKLNSEVPQDLLRKKGIADEQLTKAEQERGRKRERQSEDHETQGMSKRMRSASASTSSDSISTVSTGMSRSPNPQRYSDRHKIEGSLSPPPASKDSFHRQPHSSRSGQKLIDSEKKRRRDSMSSAGSYTSGDSHDQRQRQSSRSTRRRYQQLSPIGRGRMTNSSPDRGRRPLSNDRQRDNDNFNSRGGLPSNNHEGNRASPRERSLSPFSKRLALTQSISMGR